MARRKKVPLSGTQIAQNWQKGMQAGQTKTNYINGTANAETLPQEAAATSQAMTNYENGVNRAIQSGYRLQRLQESAQTQDWQQGCANKGATNLAASATTKYTHALTAYNTWAPIYQQSSDAAAAIAKIPGDIDNAMERARAAVSVLMNAGKRANG